MAQATDSQRPTGKGPTEKASIEYVESRVPVERLLLDPNNYRFQDENGFLLADSTRFAEAKVQDKAYRRVRAAGVSELKASILANGFLTVERLVARKYDDENYLVIEGNRRLAALKWIKDDDEAGVEIREDVRRTLLNVPVVLVENADEAAYLSIMGIRHVGGIKQWGGYQRAKVVATLRDDHGIDPAEIAARLGMTLHEVNRRYRAFSALQQMAADDEYGDRAQSTLYPIFHEAISIQNVKDWLGWDDESGKFIDTESVREFYALITPSEDQDEEEATAAPQPPKLPTYLQVRELRGILSNPEAKQVLLDMERPFADALGLAKAEELNRSWKSQVSEASAALGSISAIELTKMASTELDVVRKLVQVASEVLVAHERLESTS